MWGADMTDIFLSYNRDDQAVARRFANAFESQNFKVWWDTTLRTGEAYDEVTEAALRSAEAVVVLWSKKSVVSRWVRAEALLAYRNKTLVPCMIEPCERPIMFELTQSAEIYGWNGNLSDPRWLALLADVNAMLASNKSTDTQLASGETKVRGPAKPGIDRRAALFIGCATATGAAAVGLWISRDKLAAMFLPAQGTNSVAVLPFITIGDENSQSYFADGLSAEVRAELASNPQLRVVAQTSSANFKVRSGSAQEMASKLGVAFLLDGNVRRSLSKARVNTELIEAKSGISIWSETFDRPLDDIFAVQSEIAEAVVRALVDKLPLQKSSAKSTSQTVKKSIGGTLNVAAFENFLCGRSLYEAALSAQTDRDSLKAFDSAISLDANYAAAHAFRARALTVIANQSGDPVFMRTNHTKAIASARTAVELAPQFADAHSSLGWVLFINGLDARSAKPAFDKSKQYGSGDSDVLSGFAMFCAKTGRNGEAADSINAAIERDALNPTVFRCAGQIAEMARNHDEALRQYQRALTLNPEATITNSLIGAVYLQTSKLDLARAAFEKEPNKVFALPGLAIVAQKQGRGDAARASMAQLIADFGDSSLYQQAQVHAGWGDQGKALTTLERAYIVGDAGLSSLYVDPIFDAIRGETRFLQLLKLIGFV